MLTSEFTQSNYSDTVLTIELINEPFPYNPAELSGLQSFYEAAYAAVQGASQQSEIVVAIDEAFQGLAAWEGFMLAPAFQNVAMDTVSSPISRLLTSSSISTPCEREISIQAKGQVRPQPYFPRLRRKSSMEL